MPSSFLLIGYPADLEHAGKIIDQQLSGVMGKPFAIEEGALKDPSALVAAIRDACRDVSGILFLRKELYQFISGFMALSLPARYVAAEERELLDLLLRARLAMGKPISGISADFLTPEELRPLLKDPDIFEDDPALWTISPRDCFYMTREDILKRHVDHLARGAGLVLTNLPSVAEELERDHRPVRLLLPDPRTILREIRTLRLGIALSQEKNRPVCIYLVPRYKYTTIGLMQLPTRVTDELNAISNLVNLFAASMDAASFVPGQYEYIIFCDESRLREATASFTQFEIVKRIARETVFDAVMCIGVGKTPRLAYASAVASYATGIRIPESNAVITLEGETTLPPVIFKASARDLPPTSTDDVLFRMAEKSQISYASLNALYLASLNKKTPRFTSQEVSELLNISQRSANRLLLRLLDSGFASAETVAAVKKGRPKRIIEIRF